MNNASEQLQTAFFKATHILKPLFWHFAFDRQNFRTGKVFDVSP